VFWVIGKYGENDKKEMTLRAQISKEEDREMAALMAERRRNYYNSVSMSPRVEEASNQYLFWLKTLLNETNLKYKTFTPRDAGEFKKN